MAKDNEEKAEAKETKETAEVKKNVYSTQTLQSLVNNSPAFANLKKELLITVKLSFTGITNLVVNYEDPDLVNFFLNFCYEDYELYNETININSVELQGDNPGSGTAAKYLDQLIFGSFKIKKPKEGAIIPVTEYEIDEKTGARKRNPNGFINRKVVAENGEYLDKTLIIKNADSCQDFCTQTPGTVNNFGAIFDNFRNTSSRKKCRMILVSNSKMKLPFKVRTVEFGRVDEFSAGYIIESFMTLYKNNHYKIEFTDNQNKQIVRKLNGLTYTEGCDVLLYSLNKSQEVNGEDKKINSKNVLKFLREKINASLIEDGHGLTHLNPKPWEDYICPESSNFTFDVGKLLRDVREIDALNKERDEEEEKGNDIEMKLHDIEAIQMRMPHVIVLYGKGGTGKSAFPIHLAGLLEFDVWDFNIGASHSKWVGEGAERMRDSLKKINKATHIILRIDEYDRAMGSTGEGGNGMHEAHKQVEAEFMNWLQNSQEENIFQKQNIFVILTTNHKENITGPLLRSGRADLVIDIDNFDTKSMAEAFHSVARRISNRGVTIVGFKDNKELQKEIDKLEVEKLAEIAMTKGFTVRDVDVLITEMAAHRYYNSKGKSNIAWTNENFIKVLSKSQGSTRQSTTGELVLGDRFFNDVDVKQDDGQIYFDYEKGILKDPSKLKDIKVFDEK